MLPKETLESYEETNPDRLDPFTLKSNCNKVLINARIYLIEMAKQIRERFDLNDERLKYFSALSPYSFCPEYFRRLICHFKFLVNDQPELQERILNEYKANSL